MNENNAYQYENDLEAKLFALRKTVKDIDIMAEDLLPDNFEKNQDLLKDTIMSISEVRVLNANKAKYIEQKLAAEDALESDFLPSNTQEEKQNITNSIPVSEAVDNNVNNSEDETAISGNIEEEDKTEADENNVKTYDIMSEIDDSGIKSELSSEKNTEPIDDFGGGLEEENVSEETNIKQKPRKSNSLHKYSQIGCAICAVFVFLWIFSGFIPHTPKKTENKSETISKHKGAKPSVDIQKTAQDAIDLRNLDRNSQQKTEMNPSREDIQIDGQTINGSNKKGTGGYPQTENRQGGTIQPESGGTDVSQDPVYQQRLAMRQAYLELARQSFESSPVVQGGSWGNFQNQNNNHSNDNTTKFDPNNPFAAVDKAIEEAKNAAANAEKRAMQQMGSSGSGGIGSVASADAQSAAAQNDKERFFNARNTGSGYLSNTRTQKISPYTLPSGTIIPAALISGINSDLPGDITAAVTENVYDWANANVCLIPQGSKLYGKYSSKTGFGQKRVQISWSRIIFPDGSTLNLEGMAGVDRRGFSGLKDKVYPHYGKMFIATVMTTAFTILPALVEGHFRNDSVNVNYGYGVSAYQTAASAAAQQIGQMGNKFFDKALNQQPTLVVRPGKRFNVQVNADIPFYKAWSFAVTKKTQR